MCKFYEVKHSLLFRIKTRFKDIDEFQMTPTTIDPLWLHMLYIIIVIILILLLIFGAVELWCRWKGKKDDNLLALIEENVVKQINKLKIYI